MIPKEPLPAELIRIIYTSSATLPMELKELMLLLQEARDRNHGVGITGLLVYGNGSFLQILEGDATSVRKLFAEVSADKRHTDVTKLVEEPIDAPTFGDWSMGFVRVAHEDLLNIPGCNDIFATGARLSEIDPIRARIVLEKFREGMWHKRAG